MYEELLMIVGLLLLFSVNSVSVVFMVCSGFSSSSISFPLFAVLFLYNKTVCLKRRSVCEEVKTPHTHTHAVKTYVCVKTQISHSCLCSTDNSHM